MNLSALSAASTSWIFGVQSSDALRAQTHVWRQNVTKTILVSSEGKYGIDAGVEMLRRGASRLDVVEAAIRPVEVAPECRSVGLGGWPNLTGEAELDASIMDGRTLHSGSVGALRGFKHPISVARQVMERLPHVLLVGTGAERFAAEIGAEPARPEPRQPLRRSLGKGGRSGWLRTSRRSCSPIGRRCRSSSGPDRRPIPRPRTARRSRWSRTCPGRSAVA